MFNKKVKWNNNNFVFLYYISKMNVQSSCRNIWIKFDKIYVIFSSWITQKCSGPIPSCHSALTCSSVQILCLTAKLLAWALQCLILYCLAAGVERESLWYHENHDLICLCQIKIRKLWRLESATNYAYCLAKGVENEKIFVTRLKLKLILFFYFCQIGFFSYFCSCISNKLMALFFWGYSDCLAGSQRQFWVRSIDLKKCAQSCASLDSLSSQGRGSGCLFALIAELFDSGGCPRISSVSHSVIPRVNSKGRNFLRTNLNIDLVRENL